MPIRINNFGGAIVWWFRKHHSGLTSNIALTIAEKMRKPKIENYIKWFQQSEVLPHFKFLMIETLNRCNGTCSFCPANVNEEKRQLKKMSDSLFNIIIDQLVENEWKGTIFLQVNNEPLLDKRITYFSKRIKEYLPECNICIITNGTLLNLDKLKEMAALVDELIINNYSVKYRLNENIKSLYKYVRKNHKFFSNIKVIINKRYKNEILTTRAGNAPNKSKKNCRVDSPCLYPFTDMIVFPDGKVGMCCNDCFEVTDFGNVYSENIFDIWGGDKFRELRRSMQNGRGSYPFCVECDVVDAGSREKEIVKEKKSKPKRGI